MLPGPITIEDFSAELVRLSASQILGFHNLCEVTEIVGFELGRPPVNVLSIAVFEECSSTYDKNQLFLNKERIRIPDLKDWFFGVYRYHVIPRHLYETLSELDRCGEWKLSGDLLVTCSLVPTRPQFIPPDATKTSALNSVLKNNFWNGSYVLELFDTNKKLIMPLIEDPRRLQNLSEAIQKVLPLRIATLSDRLGNILFQMPVKVLMSQFSFKHDHGISITLAWDSRIRPRKCRVFSTMEFDGAIPGFGTDLASNGNVEIDTSDSSGLNRNILWDEEARVILAASGPLSFIREVNFGMMLSNAEPRIVVVPGSGSSVKTYRFQVVEESVGKRIGDSNAFAYRERTNQRIYSEELNELEHTRIFVQYGLDNDYEQERQRALNDLYYLLDKHGRSGAWLWDPYLTAVEIMRTLFLCKYHGAKLRALGAFEKRTRISYNRSNGRLWDRFLTSVDFVQKHLPSKYSATVLKALRAFLKRMRAKNDLSNFSKWRAQQLRDFNTPGNNYYGLNLEFRARHGSIGWSFHDRFLIFPHTEQGPLAWSLGTSINSLGIRHHILQRVDNGQLIVDAFLDLWDKLDGEDFLVWRHP